MPPLVTIPNEASYYIEFSIKEDSEADSRKSRKEWREQTVQSSVGPEMKSDAAYALGVLFKLHHLLRDTIELHNPIAVFSLGSRRKPQSVMHLTGE